jgi:transaldolase
MTTINYMLDLPSHIYLDGGDPKETRAAHDLLIKAGYHGLDGQTTNPTLIAKNLAAKHGGKKVSMKEAMAEYQRIVQEISWVIPNGKISIQVIGDPATLTAEEMLSQARERMSWTANAVIKFPCTKEALKAVEIFCQEGPVNITLNFSQEQAAAVYAATRAHNYDVYISPFVGRLDDKGQNGMDLIANELQMYNALGDGHVKVLTASIRNIDHILYALFMKSPILTIPFGSLKEWATVKPATADAPASLPVPSEDFVYDKPGVESIPYREISLDNDWTEYDLSHPLTDAGVARFWEDWKSVVD